MNPNESQNPATKAAAGVHVGDFFSENVRIPGKCIIASNDEVSDVDIYPVGNCTEIVLSLGYARLYLSLEGALIVAAKMQDLVTRIKAAPAETESK